MCARVRRLHTSTLDFHQNQMGASQSRSETDEKVYSSETPIQVLHGSLFSPYQS